MAVDKDDDITSLLKRWTQGDVQALERLGPLVQEELWKVARSRLKSERANHTLQPTALVNEVYLRLLGGKPVEWKDRVHFYAVAAKIMRRILIDHARAAKTLKRGGDQPTISLHDLHDVGVMKDFDLLALNLALDKLQALDERQARVVEMRFFGDMSVEAVAVALGMSTTQIKRDWRTAKLWLIRELGLGENFKGDAPSS